VAEAHIPGISENPWDVGYVRPVCVDAAEGFADSQASCRSKTAESAIGAPVLRREIARSPIRISAKPRGEHDPIVRIPAIISAGEFRAIGKAAQQRVAACGLAVLSALRIE
jgi:hypothetical protein